MITLEQFKQIIPSNKEAKAWFDEAEALFAKYEINTTNRIAGFMAQCAHESNEFKSLEENLNYNEAALNRVFSRYFGAGKRNAAEYARNPEKIANYVYMDEFRSSKGALGNTQAGDGWRFRGGGIKQLTGRSNYSVFAKDTGITTEEAGDYVRTKKGAFESACWFWKKNNIARFADADDIDGMSKAINGGTIGIEDRRARYKKAKAILSSSGGSKSTVSTSNAPDTSEESLTVGSRGDIVRQVQTALKIGADGIFGKGTAAAVKSWQRINRHTTTGVLTQDQIKQLLRR